MPKETFISKILDAGLKNTRYRVDVIELIYNSKTLLSAQEIYNLLIENHKKINLSTVYRTLEKLAETNIINKVNFENESQSLYEYNNHLHHHFLICKHCNKVIPIYSCPLEKYEKRLTNEYDFKIDEHRVEFYGICKDCQKKL